MSRMLKARENSALPAYNSTDRSTVRTKPEKLSTDDVDCVTIITWSTVILKGVVIVSFSNLSVEAWWEKIHAFSDLNAVFTFSRLKSDGALNCSITVQI